MLQKGVDKVFCLKTIAFANFGIFLTSAFPPIAMGQVLNVSPSALTFKATADSNQFPPPQMLQITSASGASIPFQYFATIGPAGSRASYVTVTPSSGVTPATVLVSVSGNLIPGTAQYAITFISSQPPSEGSALFNIDVADPPVPVLTSVVNAASLQPGAIAPAEIVSLIGSNLGPLYDATVKKRGFAPDYFYTTQSGGTTVTFNGTPAPIIYAQGGQVNAVVPASILGPEPVDVVVNHYGVPSAKMKLNVAASSPAIFAATENGSGQGAIINSDKFFNSADHPAPKGSIVQIFGTGSGLFIHRYDDGYILSNDPLYPPIGAVYASIGGKPAVVTYVGPAPNLVFGVFQINLVVPPDVPSGPQPVFLTIGGISNNQNVTVAVQ